MKKAIKIIAISILTVILILTGYYLYLTDFGSKSILSNEPRKPKFEIPITYNIGWWSYQKNMEIDEFNVEIIESKLNLFNTTSLISYKIKGKIKHDKGWSPKIKEVHISERINKDATQNYNRIIEITPIVKLISDDDLKKGVKKFEFINEHLIKSSNWGNNYILLKCGDKEKIITLTQRK